MKINNRIIKWIYNHILEITILAVLFAGILVGYKLGYIQGKMDIINNIILRLNYSGSMIK